MKNLISNIIGSICLISLVASCEDNYTICNEPKEVSFKGGFFKKSGGADVASPVTSLTVRPLTTTAFIYDLQPNVSTFSFALNPQLDSAKYIFKIDNSSNQDTVTLTYTSEQQVISDICGSITTHILTNAKTTKHILDSVRITSPKVDNVSNVNLKVYFH